MAYGSVAKIQIQIDLKVQSFFFFLSSTPHSTPFEYQYATGFIDGTALVMKDNKVYQINTKGEILGEETSPEVLEEFLDDATYFIDLSADVLVKLLGEEYFEDLDW